MKYFFEGRRELFKGLYIDSIDWNWDEYPVLHLDLNTGKYEEQGKLEGVLDNMFRNWENQYGIDVKDEDHSMRLKTIIKTAHEKTGRQVVILVDEYDKPFSGNLNKEDNFELMKKKHETADELVRLNYEDNPAPALNDRRHFDVKPNFNWHAKGKLGYILAVSRNLFAEVSYAYQRHNSHIVSELYRSEEYVKSLGEGGLGNIAPSARTDQSILDEGNSFDSRYKEETHDVGLIQWLSEFHYRFRAS